MAQGSRDRESVRRLMMAVLDGEATPEEAAELERRLEGAPELRAEWERLRRVKEVTSAMKMRRPPDEVWDGYWQGVYRRLERGLGWILVSVGAIILISYGLWTAVRGVLGDADLPLVVKAGFVAALVGGVVLLVSVAREKFFVWKQDPYRDVER